MQEGKSYEDVLISIIIPCYNDKKFIEQSVQSALNQTYLNKEVIVVDDGSNEETKAVLQKLAPKITKLITQENRGQSTARNAGIAIASGSYLVTLDSDDYFEPSFCEKAIALFFEEKDNKIVSCYANLLLEDGSTRLYKPQGGTINEFLYANRALGTAMFRRNDWSNCGGYDEEMRDGFEDWEFFLRLLKDGGNAAILKESLYNYRKRNDSTTNKANKIKYKILNYIYNKHSNLFKDDYEKFVKHLLGLAEKEQEEKIKNLNRIEFRLGNKMLRPLRFFKRLLS
jgi:glycosyltransferase involved in cell wall biosynthesis